MVDVTRPRSAAEDLDPSSTDPAVLRHVAVAVAEEASELVRRRRPEVFADSGTHDNAVKSKSTPTDPVTIVDTETENLVRTLLARLRPGDAVLGEEEGGDDAPPDGVRWIVDPIDGTVNFLYGIPVYSVSLAAQVGGTSVAGAVVDVVGRRTYAAHLGGGADVSNDGGTWKSLRANPVDDLGMALMATGFGYDSARRREQGRLICALLPRVRDVRRIGSAALDLCMVAAGLVDAHFEHGLSPWDWAAGSLIASEAGAVVIVPSASSRSRHGAVTVACAPGIADEFRAVLDEIGGLDPIP
ncbi:inositol monophosphatase family protein [Actinomycetes bacterium M1A6_2h]